MNTFSYLRIFSRFYYSESPSILNPLNLPVYILSARLKISIQDFYPAV